MTPQTVSKLKALMEVLKDQEGLIARVLGSMYLKRGDKNDGESMLRRAIKLCKTNEEWCQGVHQNLAQSITNNNAPYADPAKGGAEALSRARRSCRMTTRRIIRLVGFSIYRLSSVVRKKARRM